MLAAMTGMSVLGLRVPIVSCSPRGADADEIEADKGSYGSRAERRTESGSNLECEIVRN